MPLPLQALVQEEAIRNFATTIAYRMDLAKARSHDTEKASSPKDYDRGEKMRIALQIFSPLI